MNELIEKEFYEVVSKDDIEFLKKFDEMEKRAKVIKDMVKKKSYEFLEKNNLLDVGYSQDGISFSYTQPTTKRIVDIEALKEQGIYDSVLKDSPVKGYVSIKIKYED